MRNLPLLTFAFVSLLLSVGLRAESAAPGYYREPTLRGNTIVFIAEGDVWRVSAAGGPAERLTTALGQESSPALSPDGQWVAFSAQYEGPSEVYVMNVGGGLPERLTYEGENAGVRGWTPDGKVLYSTQHYSTLPEARLVAIDPKTRERTFIPLAQAEEGAYDDSGHTLYFVRWPAQPSSTKRYKGGTAQSVWRYADGDKEATPLTASYLGTSRWPMWSAGRVYFASDRDGTMNIWSMKPDGSDLKQHTHHTDFGVKNPALDAGRIVYQNGADLWLYDIASGKTAIVPIRLVSDFDQMRDRWITKPTEYLTDFDFSPTGDRLALTIRGHVFVAPAGRGRLVEVAPHNGVRYYEARFAPKGKSLLILDDQSGEVEYWRGPANGVGSLQQITHGSTNFRCASLPSPDGHWIAATQHNQTLSIIDASTGEARPVAVSKYTEFDEPKWAWSPDSKWLAYENGAPNGYGVVWLYSMETGKSTPVTSDRVISTDPAFSPNGRWLYFLSDRSFNTSAASSPFDGPWQPEPDIDRAVKIYLLALGSDTRSPFQPADELSPEAERPQGRAGARAGARAEPKDEAATEAQAEPKAPAAKTVAINLDGIESRLFEVPVPAGNYHNLRVTDKALYVLDGGMHERLMAIEIKNKDVNPVAVRPDVSAFRVSADGKKLLLREKNEFYVVDAGTQAIASVEKAKVDLAGIKYSFNPRDDWHQIFMDAWRMERDYFYDPGMNGVDWKASLARNLPLVDRVTDRGELDDAISYMVGDLGALHTFVRDSDLRKGADAVRVASLGARWTPDKATGGYRIVHLYRNDPDFPERLGPLSRFGTGINEGDTILSIDGEPTLEAADADALLRDRGGLQVLLKVRPAAGGDPFDRIVTPLDGGQASSLRYSDWEYTRRLRVDSQSDRQIGYVHMRAETKPDFGGWVRDYYPALKRPGLILDLRHNTGGNIADWIFARLLRKDWMWRAPRDTAPFPDMLFPFRAHLVVLVDAWCGSNGEILANGVEHMHLGKVIGVRTWGGGIGFNAAKNLVDGSPAPGPENGSFVPGEGWTLEGKGVVPDIVVDNLPRVTFDGSDAQLDAAIKYLKAEIAKDPRPAPTPPPFPEDAAKAGH